MVDAGNPPDGDNLIDHFCYTTAQSPETALFYLQAYEWRVDDAIFGYLGDSPSINFPGLLNDPPPVRPYPPTSEPDDGKCKPESVADPIGAFSERTGQCREAALFYLEGFQWNLTDALNGYHTGSFPPNLLAEDTISMDACVGDEHRSRLLLPFRKRLQLESPYSCESDSTPSLFPRSTSLSTLGRQINRDLTSDFLRVKSVSSSTSPSDDSSSTWSNLTDMDYTNEDVFMPNSMIIDSNNEASNTMVNQESHAQDKITLKILLRNETELELSFNHNQTIRDIHNCIDEIRPYDNKDYYFLDSEAKEHRDLDQTIKEARIREPNLMQVDQN